MPTEATRVRDEKAEKCCGKCSLPKQKRFHAYFSQALNLFHYSLPLFLNFLLLCWLFMNSLDWQPRHTKCLLCSFFLSAAKAPFALLHDFFFLLLHIHIKNQRLSDYYLLNTSLTDPSIFFNTYNQLIFQNNLLTNLTRLFQNMRNQTIFLNSYWSLNTLKAITDLQITVHESSVIIAFTVISSI